MKGIANEILFVLRVGYVIASEFLLYMIFRDYNNFIDRITRDLVSINILCVKVFQAVALNNSLIDDNVNNHLLKFTDNAPWSFDDVCLGDIVKISEEYNLRLKAGYERPINAGMISLVFKAYDKDTDKPMIIKMKRNNIEEKLDAAIKNLQTIMYLLSFFPTINKYELAELVNKNINIIQHQTNFLEEVANIERIRTNCKNLKYVKIPAVYKEVTEKYPNAILMDYIDGVKINQIKEADYEGFAKQVMKFGFVTTIVHGVTHGDLHGGNILFIKDEKDERYKHKIGVIDFGIIYELDANYKGLLFDVLTNMFTTDPKESAIKLLNSGIIDPPDILNQIPKKNYDAIIEFTTNIVNETISKSKQANQIQIYKFLSALKDYLNNSEIANIGIRPSDNFIKTQLVLAMSQGVTLTLCRDDFMTLADKVINELFHTHMIL
jgi:predicted unusual protein kinase regulating ubiquinone biosynthesis (AarF/ABC1/UbiB family)